MSEKKIYSLIPKIMSEVGAISKNNTNPGQGYKFRGIDDVYLALQGPLAKHGVFYSPEVLENNREERTTKSGGLLIYTVLKVKFTFFADDGSSFPTVTIGEAMDSGDKSANKAMSAALKYALLQVFCIPTEEPKDTELSDPAPLPKITIKDGPQPRPAQAGPVSAGEYRVSFGKYKGKTILEAMTLDSPAGVRGYIDYLENKAIKDGKPITPNGPVALFIEEASKGLAAFENSPSDNFNSDDLPF